MHRDARLTPTGRRIMVEPIAAGRCKLTSRSRCRCRGRRCRSGGGAGRPEATPGCGTGHRNRIDHRPGTPKRVEERVCRLGRSKRRGPPMIAMHTGVPASTVHEILVRPGLDRLARIDRPTGRVIRRHERARPGELIHPDVGKVAGIPPGGAGGSAAVAGSRTAGSAARTCPERSTTARGWPVSKPTTTNEPKRRSGSGLEPGTGSGPAP